MHSQYCEWENESALKNMLMGTQPPLTKKVKLTHKKWFIGSRSEGGFFHEKANRKTLLEE